MAPLPGIFVEAMAGHRCSSIHMDIIYANRTETECLDMVKTHRFGPEGDQVVMKVLKDRNGVEMCKHHLSHFMLRQIFVYLFPFE